MNGCLIVLIAVAIFKIHAFNTDDFVIRNNYGTVFRRVGLLDNGAAVWRHTFVTRLLTPGLLRNLRPLCTEIGDTDLLCSRFGNVFNDIDHAAGDVMS